MIMITLDREREIRFSMKAMKRAESISNKSYRQLMFIAGINEMQALLWAGLRHEDPNLKMDQVEKFMEDWIKYDPGLRQLDGLLAEALYEAGFLPDLHKKAEGEDGSPEAKTGGG
jgi:hypothetical protein